MKISFDKTKFTQDSQMNIFAPRWKELKRGNLAEWFIALLFIPTFGLLWYPIIALGSTNIRIH